MGQSKISWSVMVKASEPFLQLPSSSSSWPLFFLCRFGLLGPSPFPTLFPAFAEFFAISRSLFLPNVSSLLMEFLLFYVYSKKKTTLLFLYFIVHIRSLLITMKLNSDSIHIINILYSVDRYDSLLLINLRIAL